MACFGEEEKGVAGSKVFVMRRTVFGNRIRKDKCYRLLQMSNSHHDPGESVPMIMALLNEDLVRRVTALGHAAAVVRVHAAAFASEQDVVGDHFCALEMTTTTTTTRIDAKERDLICLGREGC